MAAVKRATKKVSTTERNTGLGYKRTATPRKATSGKGKITVGRTTPITWQKYNSGDYKMTKVATPRNKSNSLTTTGAREEKIALKKRK